METKMYKAFVKSKETGELTIIESEYTSKKDFARDLRANGYAVKFISTPEKFDEDSENYNWELKRRKNVREAMKQHKASKEQEVETAEETETETETTTIETSEQTEETVESVEETTAPEAEQTAEAAEQETELNTEVETEQTENNAESVSETYGVDVKVDTSKSNEFSGTTKTLMALSPVVSEYLRQIEYIDTS